VFKFIGFEEILELEAGISSNEPTQVAVRQAIESAVYALICEGAIDGLWSFADEKAGQQTIANYQKMVGQQSMHEETDASEEQTSWLSGLTGGDD
jgi:curli production assembly/transport component CsgG